MASGIPGAAAGCCPSECGDPPWVPHTACGQPRRRQALQRHSGPRVERASSPHIPAKDPGASDRPPLGGNAQPVPAQPSLPRSHCHFLQVMPLRLPLSARVGGAPRGWGACGGCLVGTERRNRSNGVPNRFNYLRVGRQRSQRLGGAVRRQRGRAEGRQERKGPERFREEQRGRSRLGPAPIPAHWRGWAGGGLDIRPLLRSRKKHVPEGTRRSEHRVPWTQAACHRPRATSRPFPVPLPAMPLLWLPRTGPGQGSQMLAKQGPGWCLKAGLAGRCWAQSTQAPIAHVLTQLRSADSSVASPQV